MQTDAASLMDSSKGMQATLSHTGTAIHTALGQRGTEPLLCHSSIYTETQTDSLLLSYGNLLLIASPTPLNLLAL